MKRTPLTTWVFANTLGFSVGFLAVLQTGFLLQFGLRTELHWTPQALGQGVSIYARFVGLLLGGALLGSAQALVLRRYSVRALPWILCTAAGFGLVVGIIWPLWAVDLWGHIPGPIEPIIITVGGGTLAGVLQSLLLRRSAYSISRWLTLWIIGLIVSIVPTALVFMLLEGPLNLSLSWPVQIALNGLLVGGVASLVSGKALLSALLARQATNVGAA